MVVASGGWTQNVSFPGGQSDGTNANDSAASRGEDKMSAKGILTCRDNSHPFQERTLKLDQAVKIGRSVAKARAAPNNAIFDCKVLSRNHALLWYAAGKFYLQDTRSSNGTFVNNQRLSPSGFESMPKEVCSGDIVQFGIDVVENTKKITHGCIVATLKLFLPDGKEAKASPSTFTSSVTFDDLHKLSQVMQEASRREKALHSKLGYLQQLVANTQRAANQSWKALIAEDRLLSWVETVENQLSVYSKNFSEDKVRSELVKLHEEKAQYQNAAKEALQKILQEKLEVTQRLVQLESRLSEAEEECQSLHNVAKHTQNELQELSIKYSEAERKLQETTEKLSESEMRIKEIETNAEREKQDLLKRLEDQTKVERYLEARLRDSRLDSVNMYKQITALRNCMQTLRDMNSKLTSSDVIQKKDDENPIEAIDVILNKLYSIYIDSMEFETESNFYSSKTEPDTQIDLEDVDSNQLKSSDNSEPPFAKKEIEYVFTQYGFLIKKDPLTQCLTLPTSRRTLVNGNANTENSDIHTGSDANSDATDDTCSVTSDDYSEKSVIENRKEEPQKIEVRFASNENGDQLEVHYEPEKIIDENKVSDISEEVGVGKRSAIDVIDSTIGSNEKIDERDTEKKKAVKAKENTEEPEEEHLEGDYVKTLKPVCKNDTAQQGGPHSREYILQTLIGSLDSLKGEDSLEAQQVVRRELEDLRDWLARESSEIVVDRLKELYYRAKNESQRIQEVSEELVILKEKYNEFVEEKAELTKKYQTLKAQCGDLLNASYTVPIHYVAPIVIALVWILLGKIF